MDIDQYNSSATKCWHGTVKRQQAENSRWTQPPLN